MPNYVPHDLHPAPASRRRRERKKIPRSYVAAAGGTCGPQPGPGVGILLSAGGPALAASPAQISKDLEGYIAGSAYPIFVIKHAQVIGTPTDNGKTETARVTITYGFIPGPPARCRPPSR